MSEKIRILVNPVSGSLNLDEKRAILRLPAEILGADLIGLDTKSAEEFSECAKDAVTTCDTLVVAGGDGTFSDILNAVDSSEHTLAYLPLGSGNALRHALGYPRTLPEIAQRIREGETRRFDLIDCDGKRRAFMASVGYSAEVIRRSAIARKAGRVGLRAYILEGYRAYRGFQRGAGEIVLDGESRTVKGLLLFAVLKQPYWGYGMRILPSARFDDGRLHILIAEFGLLKTMIAGLSAWVVGNRFGIQREAESVSLKLQAPALLETDGNPAWESDDFEFRVLPGALQIRC